MRNQLFFACGLGLIAFTHAYADQILLSNGDKITGTILDTFTVTEVDPVTTKKIPVKKVSVKTEFMGTVSIAQKGIVSVSADRPVNVSLRTGEKVVGTVATAGAEIRVRARDNTQTRAELEALDAVRNDEFQRKWERDQQRVTNPGWLDFWRATVDVGLATAQGNASTSTLSSGIDAIRRTGFDKTALSFAQIYSTQHSTEPFGKTANRVSGDARYDRDISKRVFAYGGSAFDFDEFQDLDLRSVLGGGFGWHVIARDTHTLDFAGGGNWNREKFSTGLTRNSGEISFNEKSEHQINRTFKIFQSLLVLPNLSQRGEYRLSFDGGTDLKLNRYLSWTFAVSDRYLSNPVSGNNKNDLLLTTGLRLSFEQR